MSAKIDDSVVITLTTTTLEQTTLVEHLQGVSPAIKKFLICLIEHAQECGLREDGTISVGRTQFQSALKAKKIGSSNASVSRNLGFLAEHQIAKADHEFRQDGGRTAHYRISDLSPLASLSPLPVNIKRTDKTVVSRRTKELLRMQRNVLKAKSELQFLESSEHIKLHLHEQIFNGVLDSAMRLSYSDKRIKQIDCLYFFAGAPLHITTTCSSEEGSEIMASPDQRAMRSIISLCRQSILKYIARVKEQYDDETISSWSPEEYLLHIPNLFTVDIHDLCNMMKISVKGEGPNTAASMLKRLNDTKFEVDTKDNAKFREMFSMTGKGDLLEFRFMSSLEITRENEDIKDLFGVRGELVPRFYSFQLDPRIFKSLVLNAMGLLSTMFISHKELAAERSGMAQRFSNWSRSFIGGREKGNLKDQEYDLYDMQERLSPGTRMDNFKKYFLDMMEKFNIGDPLNKDNPRITALVYGYYIHLDNSQPKQGMVIRIERDRKDPIVGDNSRHQQYLRKQAAEVLEDIEMDDSSFDMDAYETYTEGGEA
ncbi:MAG: hypothetical protein CL693_00225 [Cellvibrionaceae bacterium]|nr:hypothetical protein [Cellvibrionaceae bacterium]|tara:strand:+ start:5975 stop:7594 length:1620 start_codon:yes stop_codon:yes gene_type:complete